MKKYICSAYYESTYRGLEDSMETDDFSAAADWLWSKTGDGMYCECDCTQIEYILKTDPDKFGEENICEIWDIVTNVDNIPEFMVKIAKED